MEDEDTALEHLLEFLQQERGFDFTGYKRPSLMRRVKRRMQIVGIERFEDYHDCLEVHPEEYAQLFNTILINVTSFFRDPPAWEFLQKQVVPKILAAKRPGDPVRMWSAGCASGEEACTLAMVFAEAMGAEEFRERVKVYGTDVDEEALNHARLASYGTKEMESLDPALRDKYFEPQNSRFVFRNDLRRAVIFGRHDLVQDAPISRLDLLVCRNVLMYFNAETQSRILQRFHFALNGDGEGNGYLFLGRAEMLLSHGNLFTPLDLKGRIFAKVGGAHYRLPVPVNLGAPVNGNGNGLMRNHRLRELALEEAPVARVVVDANGVLTMANSRARVLFSLNAKDIGRPLQDLEISYRPIELRSLIEQAYAEKRAVTQTSIERRFPDGEGQYFDVVVAPLFDEGMAPLGVGITFLDVTRYTRLSEELQRSREEIQTTNEELQSANEELETTNEELQSSNEELETTNEELQSTNEELETMNEELQSTNEELQTVNEELRTRTEELNHLNAFFESVLTSLRAAAVVVNKNLDVLVWNERAYDLWGLRSEEVQSKSLLNLAIGLPVKELRDVIRSVLSGDVDHKEIVLDAVNRRGKNIKCRVTCTPLLTSGKQRDGAILLMEEAI
ncbi:MAG TPA: CheR family methyltransferase [Burkholderiales bacterium]|jgi:two-component system CheB/CheR fusion protein|nr:CheR family methyltransferase [Burkholderiales bacterium]